MPAKSIIEQIAAELRHRLEKEGFHGVEQKFSRERASYTERVDLQAASENSRGKAEFYVNVGLEFFDLEREQHWIGMPDAHDCLRLDQIVPNAPHAFSVSKVTDCELLAGQLAEWILEASSALESLQTEMRERYLARLESREQDKVSRLERRSRELSACEGVSDYCRARRQSASLPELNVFRLALDLLSQEVDACEELQLHEFQDDIEAHDNGLQDRLEKLFVLKAQVIQQELELALSVPEEAGTDDDEEIPLGRILYYAAWRIRWRETKRYLYVAAAHEDRELPYVLAFGTFTKPLQPVNAGDSTDGNRTI